MTLTTGMHIIMLGNVFAELGKKLVDAGIRAIEITNKTVVVVKMSSRHF